MREAADELEFERAARLRDRLAAVRQGHREAADGGRPQRGPRRRSASPRTSSRRRCRCSSCARAGWSGARASSSTRCEDARPREVVARILEELYYDEPPLGMPKQVLRARRARRPERVRAVADRAPAESAVEIRVPQRGDKRRLHETVTRNAKEEFTRHRLRARRDHNSRARALNELQDRARASRGAAAHRVLRHEPHPGHRLRRLDGGDGGRPARQARVPPVQGEGAVARQRRLRRHGGGADPPLHRLPGRPGAPARRSSRAAGRSRTRRSSSWSTAARASWAWRCGCSRRWASRRRSRCASLAKQFEEVYVPGRPEPVSVPRQSEALFLLQRIRDESHRFAITFHRELRGKRMTTSRARRHPRPRRGATQAPGQGARRGHRRAQGVARRPAGASHGCRTRSAPRSTRSSTRR